MNMVKKFQASGRSGFYMAVAKEGDAIELISQNRSNPTIAEIFMAQTDQ
jgi:MOSC domain-containing protein YiiM